MEAIVFLETDEVVVGEELCLDGVKSCEVSVGPFHGSFVVISLDGLGESHLNFLVELVKDNKG
jgi:hypothetical protein